MLFIYLCTLVNLMLRVSDDTLVPLCIYAIYPLKKTAMYHKLATCAVAVSSHAVPTKTT